MSAVTADDQLATGCSTRFHSHPTRNDVDTTSLFSISARRSQPSMRDSTPDGSESSCPRNESDSGPADGDSLESPGPDDLDEPWPYTFRVSQSDSSAAVLQADDCSILDGRQCMDTNGGRELVSRQSVEQ